MSEFTQSEELKCMRGSGITHAQNTCNMNTQDHIDSLKLSKGLPLSDLRVIIDWFSATFKKDVYSVEYIIEFLQNFIEFPTFSMFDETIDYSNVDNEILEKSPYLHNFYFERGYKQSITYNDIVIYYDSYGAVERGYKISLSGKGCRTFELLLYDNKTWLDFFKSILEHDTNVTRLDLAIDDFAGYLPIDEVTELLKANRLVSRLKSWRPTPEYKIIDGKPIEDGIDIGSRSSRSRIMFRLYNKALQMDVPFYWNRLEAEIKNENATNAILRILELNDDTAISKVAIGIASNYLKFCELEQTDSNRSRWKIWKNWQALINDVPKVKIGIEIPQTNIDTKRDWLYRQPPKAIAQVMMSKAGTTELTEEIILDNMDFLISLLMKGYNNLENSDLKLVEQYLNQKKKAQTFNMSALLNNNTITEHEYNDITNTL